MPTLSTFFLHVKTPAAVAFAHRFCLLLNLRMGAALALAETLLKMDKDPAQLYH